jgi:ferrous iron transport protein A
MPLWGFRKLALPALLPRSTCSGAAEAEGAGLPAAAALDSVATGLACRVVAVAAPADLPDWARWLGEIGFLPGERVTVTARSAWGGDPLVVRIGQSTFALRRAEAACVRVEPA